MTSGARSVNGQALEAAVGTLTKLTATLIAILLAVPLGWLALAAYVARVGVEADGQIIGKRETIILGGGDAWRRVFDITYRYQPADAPLPEEASHNVDLAMYDRLHPGQLVRLHYTASPLLRTWAGVGSYIDGSSPWARTRYGRTAARDLALPAAMFGAIVLGLIALKARSAVVGVAAGLLGGAAVPVALLAATALLIGPQLFWASRRRPGQGYGWMLLGAILVTAAIVYWRVPHPEPVSPGTHRTAAAVVRQARLVDEIWRGDVGLSRDGGQPIGRPFQMVDVEFTPAGAAETVHAVDRIDVGSVPALTRGAMVPVSYSIADPRGAQIVGATRTYDRAAWLYLMTIAGACALAVTFIVFPIVERISRLVEVPGTR